MTGDAVGGLRRCESGEEKVMERVSGLELAIVLFVLLLLVVAVDDLADAEREEV